VVVGTVAHAGDRIRHHGARWYGRREQSRSLLKWSNRACSDRATTDASWPIQAGTWAIRRFGSAIRANLSAEGMRRPLVGDSSHILRGIVTICNLRWE
jgi:hypothetical protein